MVLRKPNHFGQMYVIALRRNATLPVTGLGILHFIKISIVFAGEVRRSGLSVFQVFVITAISAADRHWAAAASRGWRIM